MLYTGKGDGGTTKTFGCNQRISKSSAIAEALGNLDELNSFLGLLRVRVAESQFEIDSKKFENIILSVQENIFIISAGLAGSDKVLVPEKTEAIERVINEAEKELPPIKTFSIAGGTELAAMFDFARTLARRGERRVVAVRDEGTDVHPETLKYLNRLSSLLFALARLSNLRSGINESAPSYT